MSSPVSRADLAIYQGDDYAATVTVLNPDNTPADITGFTAQAQIRRAVADLDPVVVATMTAVIASPDVSLSLSHDQTKSLTGRYVWDLQLTSITDASVTTILAGRVSVTAEVTRISSELRIPRTAKISGHPETAEVSG